MNLLQCTGSNGRKSVKLVTCISPEVDPWHTPMQMRLIEVNGSTSKELCFVKLPSFIL